MIKSTKKEIEMNEQIKELIAIGASVAAHCQPCLTFHLKTARELGVAEEDIKEAIEMGQMVEMGAKKAMMKHISSEIERGSHPEIKPDGGCCPGGPGRNNC